MIGITVENSHFGIFLPQGSTYTITSSNWDGQGDYTIRSSLNGKNYMSVAALPDNSLATLTTFAQHAFVFIKGTTVNWNFNEAAAKLTTTFDFQTEIKEGTENNILTTLFPHQWKNSTAVTNGITFDSPRGTLKCITANSFQTVLSNYGVLTQLPLTGNFPDLQKYVDDESKIPDHVDSGDNYTGGGQMAKLADLMEVAHYVGHAGAKTNFLTELKSEMENWLTSPTGETGGHYLCYNPDWQTLTPYDAYLGAEMQNDHHFAYGYMLRAAATIAKYDQVWAQDNNWGAMVKNIIRHVDSWDRSDPMFPFLRYMSPYFGHSFAGGHATGNNGNGQESSSEAINFGAAVYLWGLNTHDNTIRDLGMYLYLTEVESAKQYWWNVDGDNFPTGFAGNHVWNIDGHGGGKWTWFGDLPEYGVGINLLPIDAHSLYLAHDVTHCENLYADFLSNVRDYNSDPTITEETVWEDVIYAYRSMYEPKAVLARYDSYGPEPYFTSVWNKLEWNAAFSTFNSQPPSHFYQFVHAMDSLGQVNPSILSNYSSYGVFDKDACRHYVMYNPPGSPTRTVTFTDGKSFYLPLDTTITYKYCDPLPVTWLDFKAYKKEETVSLFWQTASEKDNSYFSIQRSGDGKTFQDIGSVAGKGDAAGISSYSFSDDHPINGKNYYRLKQVDADGKFTYSVIRLVSFEKEDVISVYPNPATTDLTVSLTTAATIDYLSLTDVLGRVVQEATPHASTVHLSVQGLPAGTYILQVTPDKEQAMVKKIMIVK